MHMHIAYLERSMCAHRQFRMPTGSKMSISSNSKDTLARLLTLTSQLANA